MQAQNNNFSFTAQYGLPNTTDAVCTLLPINANNLLAVGFTNALQTEEDFCWWLIEKSSGNIISQYQLPLPGNQTAVDAATDSEGNIFIAGFVGELNDSKALITKLKPDGNLLWKYECDLPKANTAAVKMVITAKDEVFALVNADFPDKGYKPYLLHLTTNGEANLTPIDVQHQAQLYSIWLSDKSELHVAGAYQNTTNLVNYTYYAVLNFSGNLLAEHFYEMGGYSHATQIIAQPDDGFVLSGFTTAKQGNINHNPYLLWLNDNADSTQAIIYTSSTVALYNSNYLQKTTGFITQANYGNNQNYYWYINAHVNNQNYPPQSHPLVLQILPDGSLLSTKQLFDSGATIISSGFATADGEIFYSGTTNLNPDAGFDALVSAQSIANGDSVLWSKLYGEAGGINSEAAFYLLHTADDGFLMVGNYRTTSPLQTDGMLVIKTDAEGKVEWQKNFEQEGGSLTGRGVAETATGYAFMAYKYHDKENNYKVITTDFEGNILWEKEYYRGVLSLVGGELHTTADGGLLIAGSYALKPTNTDMYLLKLNALGDSLWAKTYGGIYTDYLFGLGLCADGGYVLAGRNRSLKPAWGFNAYLGRTDADGNLLWEKSFGSDLDDRFYDAIETKDGGIVGVGYAANPKYQNALDALLLKTNDTGDSLWAKQIGPKQEGAYWLTYRIVENLDKTLTILTNTDSANLSFKRNTLLYTTTSKGFEVKNKPYVQGQNSVGTGLCLLPNGGYAIAGYLTNDNSQNIFLIRTDSLGFVTNTTILPQRLTEFNFTITPNPVKNGQVHIAASYNASLQNLLKEKIFFQLWYPDGKLAYAKTLQTTAANFSNERVEWMLELPAQLPDGIYAAKILHAQGQYNTQIVILK
ncbi:MAG: hypothetical protein OT643_02265 [Bacteroidetes bacterium]|nr:hypothetical protein [Bacteroidota bacterium]